MYKILFSGKAKKAFAKLSPNLFIQIFNDIVILSSDPRPQGYKKLVDRDGYRFRSGNFRILYYIDDTKQAVFIFSIVQRKDAY